MASVFSTDLITFELNAADKVDAISQMAKLVVASGRGSDAEQITKDVLARDEMGTPQVDGVAIPHARTSGVSQSSVAVARSVNQNIIFDEDEGAAEVLFMILVPNEAGDEHISILSSLARRLMDDDFTKALRTTNDPAELVSQLENQENG
jgi:mannitol/fructose-specific phosphotransferase system IIA component (Ntr-type)